MPVILATQEVEISRIVVWNQPGQIVCKTLSQEKKTFAKKGWWSGSRYRFWVQIPVLQKQKQNQEQSHSEALGREVE
jgi:hypothetical protein